MYMHQKWMQIRKERTINYRPKIHLRPSSKEHHQWRGQIAFICALHIWCRKTLTEGMTPKDSGPTNGL